MLSIITTFDGMNRTMLSVEDFFYLVREKLGIEAELWLGDYLDETRGEDSTVQEIKQDHEKELAEIREKYQTQIREIRQESEKLSKLIQAEDIDRKAISQTAGRIGVLTWEALNRAW